MEQEADEGRRATADGDLVLTRVFRSMRSLRRDEFVRVAMIKSLQVTAIIPTKNRPNALALAVRSLLSQTVIPRSLVIVDQSPNTESHARVDAEFSDSQSRGGKVCCLEYIHDPAISGQAAACNRAMALADGDIWLFLDDDVCLEPDFVEQLITVYRDHPEAAGVSGIITNYSRPPLAFRLWSRLFVHRPFKDERQPIYWNAERLRESPPMRVRGFTGASMSFRAKVICGKRLDENLGAVWYVNDLDFCFRLGPDTVLLIAPRARLQHLHSPVGRLADHWLRRHAHANLFLYRRHWNEGVLNRLSYGWLLFGYSTVATVACFRRFSLDPWHALRLGAREASNALANGS